MEISRSVLIPPASTTMFIIVTPHINTTFYLFIILINNARFVNEMKGFSTICKKESIFPFILSEIGEPTKKELAKRQILTLCKPLRI